GLRAMALEPTALRVELMSGQWCVKQGSRVLFNFGPRADEARQALQLIQKHQFNQVGLIGQGAPSMYVFLHRDQGKPGGNPAAQTGARLSGKSVQVNRFSRLAKNQPEKKEKPNDLSDLPAPALPALASGQGAHPHLGDHGKFAWRSQPHFGPSRPAVNTTVQERVAFDWRQ